MEFEERKKISTHLDIAPLIDIVFLLIIFFMLTANFIMQPGIKVKLPAAESARPEKQDSMTIYISSDSVIYLNGTEVEMAGLAEELSLKLANEPGLNVALKADEKVDLGLAVRVMDIARKAGAGALVISTDPGKKGK
ncbi:MAG: biopolymer transporter ExbD [Candidatus Omnitrophica bacterium]|nr:biopolymer transporter ExbD [Candidatus Omnitrophota bacterium]MDD5487806.1 biopolymer transporter ExbD [Candidatus Omnitrophota bacterium]